MLKTYLMERAVTHDSLDVGSIAIYVNHVVARITFHGINKNFVIYEIFTIIIFAMITVSFEKQSYYF